VPVTAEAVTVEAAFSLTSPKGVVLPTRSLKVILPVPLVNSNARAPSKVELNRISPAVAPVVIETEPVVNNTGLLKVTVPPAPALPVPNPDPVPTAPPVVSKVDLDRLMKLLLPAVIVIAPPAPPLNVAFAAAGDAPGAPTAVIDPTVIAPAAVVIVTLPAFPPFPEVVEVVDAVEVADVDIDPLSVIEPVPL